MSDKTRSVLTSTKVAHSATRNSVQTTNRPSRDATNRTQHLPLLPTETSDPSLNVEPTLALRHLAIAAAVADDPLVKAMVGVVPATVADNPLVGNNRRSNPASPTLATLRNARALPQAATGIIADSPMTRNSSETGWNKQRSRLDGLSATNAQPSKQRLLLLTSRKTKTRPEPAAPAAVAVPPRGKAKEVKARKVRATNAATSWTPASAPVVTHAGSRPPPLIIRDRD